MALIHVFDGLNHNTSYTFNGRLRDHIKGVNWENSIILRGGYRVDADYEVQPDDIIYVRKTPAAATTVAIVAIAAVAITAGVVAGVSIYQQKQAEKEMEAAQKAAKAGAEQTGKLPFVKGARNQAATGQTFPYIIGETLFTPYRLCPAHYTIAGTKGEEQFYNVVLECGYNNLVIDKIKMGETVIKAFNGDAPQNGEYSWDEGTYYDERNKIEIRQTGDFINADFNEKIVMTELTEEIPHEHASSDPDENARIEAKWQAGVVQELPSRPMKVELIALFDGLQRYDDGWKSQTITLQPQWTNNPDAASPTWHDFDTGFIQNGTASNEFTYNTKQQMRYSAVQTFTAAQAYGKKISVRVRRTTPKAESNAKDTVYLLAVQTTCYDAKKSTSSSLVAAKVLEDAERDKCTRLGIRVAANANTRGNLDAFSIITRACARTWNGSAWTSARTPTSNLAAWVLEIMTSSKHAPSKYEDSELDLATFGEWYTYCQTQGFRADGVICRPTKKKSIIETLCRNGNAALVFNPMTGKIEVAIDNGRDYSIALLNSDTIQTISTTKEFKRKTTGKKVTYVNKDEDYDADSVIFMRDGGDYDPQTDTLTQTALEYITTYQHAFKYAWRQMAEEMAQPRVATVKVGREAAYYPIFSRVELQHKSLKIGLSHGKITGLKWQSGLLKEIYIEGTVTFPANVACGVIINCVSDSGRGLCALKVTGTGTTSTLTVTTTIRQSADIIPRAGDYFSFGKLDNDGNFTTVTNTMKITNAEETDDGYTLTLVDYNAALYTYGTLPEYKSNLTKTPDGSKKTVESQRDYVQQGEAEALASGAVQAAVDTTIKGVRFTNVYKVKPVEMSLEEIVAKMDADARNASASISISEDAILLKVEDLDEQQRAFISLTKSQILAQVDDMAQELTGLIDVQAGAVTALVEGGGAAGQMSLSLNLPVMIDANKRAQFVAASTEAKVAAVYAQLEGTSGAGIRYAIKGNASNAAVKALWDDAVAGALIASQIDLTATQIHINAQNVQIDGETIINNAKKIKAALIDVATILGENAYFLGAVYSSTARFKDDCFLPMIEFAQSYTDDTNQVINMSTETVAAIKTKLDNIINNAPARAKVRLDYEDETAVRVYIQIVSAEQNKTNVTKGAMCAWYLQRYTNYDGYLEYDIWSISGFSDILSSTKRPLIIDNSKYTSSTLANKLEFNYYGEELGINAGNAYFSKTLQSRNGYVFGDANYKYNQSFSHNNSEATYYKLLESYGVDYSPRLCVVKLTDGYYLGCAVRSSATVYRITGAFKYENRTSSNGNVATVGYATGSIWLEKDNTKNVSVREIYF